MVRKNYSLSPSAEGLTGKSSLLLAAIEPMSIGERINWPGRCHLTSPTPLAVWQGCETRGDVGMAYCLFLEHRGGSRVQPAEWSPILARLRGNRALGQCPDQKDVGKPVTLLSREGMAEGSGLVLSAGLVQATTSYCLMRESCRLVTNRFRRLHPSSNFDGPICASSISFA